MALLGTKQIDTKGERTAKADIALFIFDADF